MGRLRRRAAALLCVAMLVFAVAPASAEEGQVATEFLFTGAAQEFLVPPNVTELTIEAWGAQGYQGGAGGYAKGTFSVLPGQKLTVRVGGTGTAGSGGYNGGGDGSHGGGGGASDVRWPASHTATPGLTDRKVVAGGGGGYGGGGGGGPEGESGASQLHTTTTCWYDTVFQKHYCNTYYNGSAGAGGGTQTDGGSGAASYTYYDSYYRTTAPGSPGTLGQGGAGANGVGGGGGGGWYGGGGGAAGYGYPNNSVYGSTTGGGGGSSYTAPEATSGSTSSGINSGHGRVVISYSLVPVPIPTPPGVVGGQHPTEPCSDESAHVDTLFLSDPRTPDVSARVYRTATDTEVCVSVQDQDGADVWSEHAVVPHNPLELVPPLPNPNDYIPPAPVWPVVEARDGRNGSCTKDEGSFSNPTREAYLWSGTNSQGERVFCVGVRSEAGTSHQVITLTQP